MKKYGSLAKQLFLSLWVSGAVLLYVLFAAISWMNYTGRLASNPSRIWDQHHLLPEAFFAMFWFSGNAALHHAAAALGIAGPPSPWLTHTLHMPISSQTPFFHLTWLYPPTMGLLALSYAALPLPISFWVWRALYFAISATLLRRAGLAWPAIILGLAGPAAMIDLVEGENGTLTGGLIASALLLADKAPKAAGLVTAMLSIKPQIGISMIFALVQPRARVMLITAAAGFGALALATLPLFGLHGWIWFLSHSPQNSSSLVASPFGRIFPEAGSTTFYMARSFGAGVRMASALQAISSLCASLALWQLWRVPGRPEIPRMAVTLALTVLLVPYGYLYDLVGFSVGMAALCLTASPSRQPLYAMLWLFAGHSATVAGLTQHIFMPVAAVLGAIIGWQELTAPHTPPHAHNPA
ncbi:glycosyltransferase family 87 protein [Acidocella sp. KAb 2-4]|uniref:glycosyltransferase family 87 protein n=1 Tax=Acidocella sp. KAb 2-4 TaxID=2885158 RepID=UPI001D094DA7|nr:glycosyltransferase family 87 protein [Acidocella sp. KAb 2-4]MCB5944911.1 DUF2029 domain-containing protein [Acidocella sp. KAb 2-4]